MSAPVEVSATVRSIHSGAGLTAGKLYPVLKDRGTSVIIRDDDGDEHQLTAGGFEHVRLTDRVAVKAPDLLAVLLSAALRDVDARRPTEAGAVIAARAAVVELVDAVNRGKDVPSYDDSGDAIVFTGAAASSLRAARAKFAET